jgi:hypothetical protein
MIFFCVCVYGGVGLQVWNLQQLIEDAYAGRQTNAKATTFTAWNEAALEDGRVAHGGGINSEDGSNSAAKAPSAFSLDHVVLAPPGVHDRNFYASNGLPPLRASGVHGALWQDLLSGACGRLGGGREGADLMNSSTVSGGYIERGRDIKEARSVLRTRH